MSMYACMCVCLFAHVKILYVLSESAEDYFNVAEVMCVCVVLTEGLFVSCHCLKLYV